MRAWRWLGIGALGVLLVGAVFASGYLLGHRDVARAEAGGDFDVLLDVQAILDRSFIGEIPSTQQQAYGAAHGLVTKFGDPYTVFVEPAPWEMERDELAGHFGGIGAYMSRNEAGALILTVMRDRPAAKAGIQDDDILLEVDGKLITQGTKVDEVVALVRGNVGTKVSLKLQRPGQVEPYVVSVVRERIETPSVEWRVYWIRNSISAMPASVCSASAPARNLRPVWLNWQVRAWTNLYSICAATAVAWLTQRLTSSASLSKTVRCCGK